jgi:hypothetical protein
MRSVIVVICLAAVAWMIIPRQPQSAILTALMTGLYLALRKESARAK